MNVVVCVKQIPDPAAPRALDPDQDPRPHGQADPRRVRQPTASRWRCSSSTGRRRRGHPGLDGPERSDVAACATALAMGAAKAVLVSDDALRGSDALGTAKVLATAITPGRARPHPRRDRVVRRLHRHVARPARRAARLPSITFAKAVAVDGGSVTVERQTEAGYDEVECPLPAVGHRHRRRGRAPLPVLQGDHGRQVQAASTQFTVADLGLDAGQVGAAGARQEIVEVVGRRGARGRRDRRGRGRRLREGRRASSSSSRSSEPDLRRDRDKD